MQAVSLEKGKSPRATKKQCPEYDTKLHLITRLQFWSSGRVWSTSLLPLTPGLLGPGVVVLVRVSSIGQIDLFKNSIGPCAKKSLKNQLHKNINIQ